jgi:hypothetical protein
VDVGGFGCERLERLLGDAHILKRILSVYIDLQVVTEVDLLGFSLGGGVAQMITGGSYPVTSRPRAARAMTHFWISFAPS